MEDQQEITMLCLVIIIVVFAMAIFAHPRPADTASQATLSKKTEKQDDKKKVELLLPIEHPGGYELYLA